MGSYNRRANTRCWPGSYLHYHDLHSAYTLHRRPRVHHPRYRHAPNNRRPLTTHLSTRNSIRRQPRNGPWTAQLLPSLRAPRTSHSPSRRRSRKHILSLPSGTRCPMGIRPSRLSLLRRPIQGWDTILARPIPSRHRLPARSVSTEKQSTNRITDFLHCHDRASHAEHSQYKHPKPHWTSLVSDNTPNVRGASNSHARRSGRNRCP